MIINGQEIEVYTLNDDGQEVDRAVDFGKNPDALPTENSEVGVKSGGVFTAIKNTKETLEQKLYHRNLLDNPLFRIDQRQGYVVPPNKNYYSDTALSALVGQTSEYTTVTAKASGYNTINISGTDYYVAVADCVRGYVGSGMVRINDRYAMYTAHPDVGLILINDDGSITATHLSGTRDIVIAQNAPDELKKEIRGKTVTLSIIANGNEYTRSWTIPESGIGSGGNIYPTNKSGTSYEIADGYCYYRFWLAPSGTLTVSAVKLELGSISTLEAEIASGAYNEDADLRECKKYYRPQSTSTVQGSYTEGYFFELCLTNLGMRIKPNVDTSHQQKVYWGSWVDVTYNYSEGDGDTLVIKYTMGSYPNDYRPIQFLFVPALSAEL